MILHILPGVVLSLTISLLPLGGEVKEAQPAPAPLEMTQPILRCERFVLEVPVERREGADSTEPLPARPIGFVEWRRRVDPSGSVLLERDTWFQEDGLRLRQTESLAPAEEGEGLVPTKMIWREQLGATEDGRPGLSRSLVFSPSRRPGEWTLLDRFAGRSDRTGLRLPESGPAFPLLMVERLREERDAGATRFSALSKSFETVVSTTKPAGKDQRISEIRRQDGSLLLQLTFQSEEILSFRFQETGVNARRVDEVEWRRLKDRLNTSH